MKKLISVLLVLCLCLGLAACGGGESENNATTGSNAGEGSTGGVFKAGFGMVDITPKDPVPLDSYGDAKDRISTGLYSKLEARAVVVQDAEGGMLVFATGDVSWCPKILGLQIRYNMSEELGIPEEYIILSGTHTHSSVAVGLTEMPAVSRFNERYVEGMCEAIRKAVADLKPAEVYVGSVMTEGMNFVRRYIMDDGSLSGDNAYGTGTKLVSHETDADPELQLMKFVREGGKDILISNFQAHPHLEGKTNNVSAQTVGAIRDAVEKELDAHSLHWQGAAGNLNTLSRLEGENKYTKNDRVKYGQDMCKYIKTVYNDLEKVNSGKVKAVEIVYEGPANHVYDHMLIQANDVVNYFKSGHTAAETATYAHQYVDENGLRINSYYHANRIIGNAKLGATTELVMAAWGFGDVGGVVNAYEMFDTNGMYIKENSPFVRTFIVGYAYPTGGGYIPSAEGFKNGGYESDNCMFAPGTGEILAEKYVSMLTDLRGN